MTETRKAALITSVKSAAMDVLACLERIEAGGGEDDMQIMYEAAWDTYTCALDLRFDGVEEAAA
ncbi:hypothetical protein [Gordonibacter sp.]|uniref:hypothetical protein n=1 Tax=Gordonibacter sp. TaxID=1968902 RepID=UPI002FC61BC6